MWAKRSGSTVSPACFRCLTASPRWAVFQRRSASGTRRQTGPRPGALRPGRSDGKVFFNILATFAEFEADLIRMRTREGMAIARARGKLRGKQPKLSDRQQRELCRMHATGEYSISDLAEFFSVSRPTVHRTLNRHLST